MAQTGGPFSFVGHFVELTFVGLTMLPCGVRIAARALTPSASCGLLHSPTKFADKGHLDLSVSAHPSISFVGLSMLPWGVRIAARVLTPSASCG